MRLVRWRMAWLLLVPGLAQAGPLSLRDVLRAADEHSVALEAEARRADATDAASDEVRAGVLPSLSATGLVEVGEDPRYAAYDTLGPIASGALRAEVPLVEASTWASLKAANLRREVGRLGLESARETVLLEAALGWVELVRAEQAVTEAQSLLDRSRRLADLARSRVEVGSAAPIEATRAELLEAQDEQRLIAARVDADAARLALLEVAGLPLDASLEVREEELATPVGDGPERPDLRAARLAEDVARADRAAVVAGIVPQVDVAGTAGVLSIPGEDARPTGTVGLEATMPLFAGTARSAEARRLAAERDAAHADAEDLARRAAVDVAVADQRVEAGGRAWEVSKRARTLAEREVSLAEDRFSTGAASNVEVVDAQGRLATAIRDEVEARAERDRSVLLAWSARGRLRELAGYGVAGGGDGGGDASERR